MVDFMDKVCYIKKYAFADGSIRKTLCVRERFDPSFVPVLQQLREDSKFYYALMRNKWLQAYYETYYFEDPYDIKTLNKLNYYKFLLQNKNPRNVARSVRRCRQAFYDILKCNDFKYFVTLTFDNEKIDRYNDVAVRKRYTEFMSYIHKQFPSCIFCTVPEYHSNWNIKSKCWQPDALHFHLLVGGVDANDIGLVPARYPNGKRKGQLIFKHGMQIFNATKWTVGFSTVSVIRNTEAAKKYLCKYVTKQHYDERFFNKKRFYCSRNCVRPSVETSCVELDNVLGELDFDKYVVSFANADKGYVILETLPNSSNSENTIKSVAKIFGVDSSYLTLRTFNSNYADQVGYSPPCLDPYDIGLLD